MEQSTSNKPQASTQELDYNDLGKLVLSKSQSEASQNINEASEDAYAEQLGQFVKSPRGALSSIYHDMERDAAREAGLEDGSDTPVIGMDFDYNYSSARPKLSQDLHELQAQRQSQWTKRAFGVGRVLGETALNILEIPGVVFGAMAAGVTLDSDKMTDNFWVRWTDGMKEDLHDILPVYQRRAVKEGNVWDKMFSADWWATDGASGIAFMASALVPGLGLAKLPKALSITSKLSKGGRYSSKVLGMLDDVAAKTGLAKKTALMGGKGAAAKQGIDVFNATVANTLFEAGVEARGAQMSYEDSLLEKLEAGEIDYNQYQELKATSGQVAANVFGANAALLLGPNMVMSRMMLGARGLGGQKTYKATQKEAGRLAKKTPKEFVPYEGVGKKIINPAKKFVQSATGKGALGIMKRGALNTGREGLLEEGGQGAIEKYFTEGTLEKQLHGSRSRSIAKEYMNFIGTADGQAAVLLGGLLSGPMSYYSHRREQKEHLANVDSMIKNVNSALDLQDVLKGHLYKTDPNDPSKILIGEDGKPIADLEKQARLADTIAVVEATNKKINSLLEQGDEIGAQALAAKLQAQVHYGFLKAGDQGIDAMREFMLENPITDITVAEYNKENGTNLTKEQYVDAEVKKATDLKDDYFTHLRDIEKPLTNKDARRQGISREDREEAEGFKETFNNEERVKYTTQQAVKRHFEEVARLADQKIAKAQKDGNRESERKARKEKIRAQENLKDIQKNIEDLSSTAKMDARWDKYYAERKKVQRINNKEVTDYLDGVISSIKDAKTEQEVEEIVKKAKEDGLILKGVKKEALPEELVEMASSDNVIESLGAYLTLVSSETEGLFELAEEARRNINRLYEGTTKIYQGILDVVQHLNTLEEQYSAKRDLLAAEFDELASTVNALTTQLNIEEREDRRKITKAAKANYRAAVKAKNETVKLLTKVEKEIAEIDAQRRKNFVQMQSYTQALNVIANAVTNKELRKSMKDYLATDIDDKTVFTSANILDRMPITLDEVLEAMYVEKELMMDMADDVVDIAMESSEHEYLTAQVEYFKHLKAQTEILKARIEQTIKRNANLVKTPENQALLLESKALAQELGDRLAEIEVELFKAEDKLAMTITGQIEQLSSFANKVEEVIQALENLDISAITKEEESAPVEEEFEEYEEAVNPREEHEVDYVTEEVEGDPNFKRAFSSIIEAIDEGKGLKATTPPAARNEFVPYKDSTEGKGFERVNEEEGELFKLLFSETEEALLNGLSDLVKMYEKDKKKTNPALRDIYMILRVHPHLADKVSDEIHMELAYASEEAMALFSKFSTYKAKSERLPQKDGEKSDKGEKSKKGKKGKKDKESAANPFMEFLIEDTNIDKEIQAVIDEKKASLRQAKINKLRATAEEAGLKWNLAIAKNDAITEGAEVHWQEGETSHKGTVELMLRTKESGINVMVQKPDGSYKMISIERLSKKDRNATVLNKTTEQAYEEFAEERRKRAEGNHTSTGVPLVHRGKPAAVRDPKTGQIKTSSRAFLDYMHEPRDKSNDVITPSFTISYAKHLAKQGDANAAKVVEIFEKYQKGGKLTVDEIEHLADYMPISLRVESTDGLNAGTFLPIKTDANTESSFKSMEGAVRRKIITAWLEAGGELHKGAHPNTLTGITLRWSHVSHGQLNVDPQASKNGFNKLTNLQGVTQENMEIFAIQEDTHSMKAYDRNGQVVPVPFTTDDKKGMVVLQVPTNTGKPFPIVLEQKQLQGSNELDAIMMILDDIMSNDTNMTKPISKETREFLKENIPLLFEAFQGKEITNQDLYRTILYPGKQNTQTRITVTSSKKQIKIGDIVYTQNDYNSNRETIKKILGYKYHRTGFTNPGKEQKVNMLTVQNEAYLKYLLEDKILRTNVMENEAIFVSVPVEGSKQHKGMGAFLTPGSVRSEKGTKQGTKPEKVERNVVLNKTVRARLYAMGVKTKTLSNARIQQLNELYETTKFAGAARGEFEQIVQQINDEAQDNKPKEC